MWKQYKPILINFVIAMVILKFIIGHFMDQSVHRTKWYKVDVPPGWTKKVDGEETVFIAPDENIMTGLPDAVFSIYGEKSEGSLFLPDILGEVMQEYMRMDGQILNRGEIKIDGLVSKWILYRNNDPDLMVMTFFIVDDFNRLIRIQFTTASSDFSKYRPVFEKFKDSIEFKRLFK